MELLGIVLAMIVLAGLAARFGYDSRVDEQRYLSKEQELAAYGVTWTHPAQPLPGCGAHVDGAESLSL